LGGPQNPFKKGFVGFEFGGITGLFRMGLAGIHGIDKDSGDTPYKEGSPVPVIGAVLKGEPFNQGLPLMPMNFIFNTFLSMGDFTLFSNTGKAVLI
jgi:hypothetical protein